MKYLNIKDIAKIALLSPIIYFSNNDEAIAPETYSKLTKDPRKVVVLDPGHGMSNRKFAKMDWGDAKYKEYREANLTLQQAKNIKNMLNPSFYKVILTRNDNFKSAPIYSRPELANTSNADIFISLHINNHNKKKNLRGFEVYYRDTKSQELAKLAIKNLEEIPSLKKRLVMKKEYLMLKNLNCPGILIESGYLPGDRKVLLDTTKCVEEAIVKTIEDLF